MKTHDYLGYGFVISMAIFLFTIIWMVSSHRNHDVNDCATRDKKKKQELLQCQLHDHFLIVENYYVEDNGIGLVDLDRGAIFNALRCQGFKYRDENETSRCVYQ